MIDMLANNPADGIKVLDKGLVKLIDVMPRLVPDGQTADSAIVQAARVSYGDGTKSINEDEGLIRYLLRHGHCYDKDTEVLTNRGFVCWSEVKPSDELGIWDDEAQTLCYEVPEYLTRQNYSGDMYKVNHWGVDLLVTPDHKMWVRTKVWSQSKSTMVWSGQSLIKSSTLGNRSMVRYTKLAPFISDKWDGRGYPKSNDVNALLEFIGFFVGDGHADKTSVNSVRFHIKKSRKLEYIRDVVSRMGWEIKERASYGGRKAITVYSENIGRLFRNEFYNESNEKVLPKWATMLDEEDAQSLLVGLRNSDGTQKRGAWEYSTSSKVLANQVQLLCLHAGEAAHIVRHDDTMFGVSVMSRMREPVINQTTQDTSIVKYTGEIFCAKTRTGILVVRRNGKIVLSGNTTPLEMVEFKFLVKLPIFCARQMIRHRTANVNEYSGRYSVMKDEFYIPDEENIRQQSKTNKQGGDTQVDENVARRFKENISRECRLSYDAYTTDLEDGISREQARMQLQLNLYTEWYWKTDLHNLLHFLGLRCDAHAQWEMRQYGEAMLKLIEPITPMAVRAWNDYHHLRGAVKLTALEVEAIRNSKGNELSGMLDQIKSDNKREREEWISKAKRLGYAVRE